MPRQWHTVTFKDGQTQESLRKAFWAVAGFDPAVKSESLELLTGVSEIVYQPSDTGGRLFISEREMKGMQDRGYDIKPETASP